MEREEIIKRFKEKGFNEKTIELLLGVINDFELTQLTKYVPIEEVVNRICQNLKQDIEFDNIENRKLGFYYPEQGKIVISETLSNNPDRCNSTIFHEVMHCITDFKDTESVRILSNI